jgi:hypothetical protein
VAQVSLNVAERDAFAMPVRCAGLSEAVAAILATPDLAVSTSPAVMNFVSFVVTGNALATRQSWAIRNYLNLPQEMTFNSTVFGGEYQSGIWLVSFEDFEHFYEGVL